MKPVQQEKKETQPQSYVTNPFGTFATTGKPVEKKADATKTPPVSPETTEDSQEQIRDSRQGCIR